MTSVILGGGEEVTGCFENRIMAFEKKKQQLLLTSNTKMVIMSTVSLVKYIVLLRCDETVAFSCCSGLAARTEMKSLGNDLVATVLSLARPAKIAGLSISGVVMSQF